MAYMLRICLQTLLPFKSIDALLISLPKYNFDLLKIIDEGYEAKIDHEKYDADGG